MDNINHYWVYLGTKYAIHPIYGIYNLITKIRLAGYLQKDGYPTVKLDGKLYKIHVLVALAFIPNPNNYQEVNHKNKNKTDNRVENLEWVTSQENLAHAHNKTVYQYSLNWDLIQKYSSLKEASMSTGINHKNISHAIRKGYPYTASKYYWTYSEVRKIKDENRIFIILF